MYESPTQFVGIDPGVTGAIAVISTDDCDGCDRSDLIDEIYGELMPESPTQFVGVDPGVTGAIAVISTGDCDACVTVHDMPVYKMRVGKTNRSVPDWYEIIDLITPHRKASFLIEQPQPMGRDGSSAAFGTGRFLGGMEALVAALGITTIWIRPVKWKRYFGLLKQTKDASRKKAIELFPDMAEQLKLKKHHGRAEALLIAEYLRRDLGK